MQDTVLRAREQLLTKLDVLRPPALLDVSKADALGIVRRHVLQLLENVTDVTVVAALELQRHRFVVKQDLLPRRPTVVRRHTRVVRGHLRVAMQCLHRCQRDEQLPELVP